MTLDQGSTLGLSFLTCTYISGAEWRLQEAL